MRVPAFVVRQFYVAGSLRAAEGGFSLQATNPIGDGTLVGIGRVSVDGIPVALSAVTAVRDGESDVHRAVDVSPASPVAFRRGDRVTFRVADHPLAPGEHTLEVELVEVNVGRITISFRDVLHVST
jgi:hypothetical protein